MKEKVPSLSVVMPVHNARPFLDESIASILDQTFADFEFVIFNDASTDGSADLIHEWAQKDRRIRVYESPRQLGLSGSSNYVVSKACASIVARMDADDVSHPDRLSRQWQVIESDPDVVVVGTLCDGIDASGRRVRPRDRWRLVRRSPYVPFPHGSAMFRKKTFEAVAGFRERYVSGEDQDFLFRMASRGRAVTLPDILYHYRYHLGNSTIFHGVQRVRGDSQSGNDLAGFYRLGTMLLWAGYRPRILKQMLASEPSWSLATLMALTSAAWGTINPSTLRFFLRLLIRARDLVASLRIKDGRPYEWRLE